MLRAKDIKGKHYKEYILGEVLGEDRDKTVDYYTKNDGNSPFSNSYRFIGGGCEEFGYQGSFEDKKDIFKKFFDGKDPRTKPPRQKYLVQNWKKTNRRVGTDLTFSAPKSVTVALAWAETHEQKELAKAIIEAHRAAVSHTFKEMEKNAVCRGGKGGQKKFDNVKMFGFEIDHDDTRPVKAINPETGLEEIHIDPQLHTHLIALNYGLCADGKTRALDALSLSQQYSAAGAIYRAKLAEELQKAGLTISNEREMDEVYNQETKKTNFKLNGISQKAEELFSKRGKSIDEYMEEHGLPANRLNEAVRATRLEKDGQPYEQIREDWKNQIDTKLEKVDIDLKADLKDTVIKEKSIEEIIDDCHNFTKKTRLTKFDILEVVAQIYTGHPEALKKIEEKTQEILSSDLLCRFAKLDDLEKASFCSLKLAKLDKEIRDTAKASLLKKDHKIEKDEVERLIADFEKEKGFKLSAEQEKALRNGTSGSPITLLKGRAGSGKTSSAWALISAYEGKGYDVVGTAIAWKAAKTLEKETEMKSFSIAKLLSDLEKGQFKPTAKTLIYIDEAGMLDIEATSKLLKIQRETGCRMLFAGDVDQVNPVGAGNGLRILQSEIKADELKEIRRQRKSEKRKIAEDFYTLEKAEQGQALFKRMQEQDMIKECPNAYTTVDRMAEAYVNDPNTMEEKLAMASTNDGVVLLNKAIQKKMIEAEILPKTIMGSRGKYDFREGDTVRFGRSIKFKDEGQEVINGSYGTVVNDDSGRFRVRLENGEVVSIREDIKAIDLAYATTIHRSQGATVNNGYLFADSRLNRNLALVAYTRIRDNFQMFGEEKFLEDVKNNLHRHSDEAGVYKELREGDRKRVDDLLKVPKQKVKKEIVMNFEADFLAVATKKMEEQREATREAPQPTKVEKVEIGRVVKQKPDRWSKAPSKLRKEVREDMEEEQKKRSRFRI